MLYLRHRIWFLYRLLFKKSSLEIEITSHCNLNCIGCSHYSPLAKQEFVTVKELKLLEKNLEILSNSFKVIRIMGGEPLLNNELHDILTLIRKIFPKTKIEIVTNGLLLLDKSYILNYKFWESCRTTHSIINITNYPINLNYDKIITLCKKNDVEVIITPIRDYNCEFVSFKLDPRGKGSKLNYYQCFEMDFLQLYGNKIFSCPQCAYIDRVNKKTNIKFDNKNNKNFIELSKIKYPLILRLFRLRAKPFCKYCIFPRSSVKWRKSNGLLSEWIKL